MKFHAVSEIFPRMPENEFAELREDIRAHGVHEPAWIWNGQVIDGRHRALACDEIGLKCPTREWVGIESDLVPFVLSLNLKRRHLDASQRAMVAAGVANLERGANQHAQICAPSQSEAAEMLNVSRRSVQAAKKFIEDGVPELKEAVEQGKVSVAAAAEVAELPKKKQKRVVAEDRVQEVAAERRAERKPKAEPAPKAEKPDELDALKAENEQLREKLAEMASHLEPLLDEAKLLEKIEGESDKLAAACAEVKRLVALVRVLEERNRGFQNEKNDAIRAAKMWQNKFLKLEREIKKGKA
jgi:hypothetical protein